VGGAGQPAVSGAIERLEQKENSVAAQYDEVAQRVRAHFRQLRDLVAERESQLASALLQVKTLKLATLQEQRAALMEAGAGADLTYLLQPWEDERLFSVQPPLDLARLVRTSCAVYSSACAQFCRLALANGDKAFVGKPFAFRLLVFDHLRQPCTVSANEIDLHLRLDCADAAALNPYGQVQPLSFPGQYQVTLVPERPGRITVNLRLRGRHVPGSPFVLPALEARDYAQLGSDVRVIGRQGDGDLEFNRPWGICADNADNLVIADRSNNQIKIVHSSGSFLRKFGQRGEGPASVCLGSDKRIYVADKDNHRVQVFTWTGQFIRVFGKQGKGPGEFNYPWDLAVGKAGRLAVADSRNHRIQLFSEDGDYVTEFSIARSPGFAGIKSFDCPRGIVFTSSGQLLCTDFNLHRFLVIESDFSQVRFMGVEGQGPGQFCRPQGIAVDLEGNIIICEARNHRLQILNSRGAFVRAFGSNAAKIGQLNRPACVCVLSTGQLAVVDSENHRVLLL
uniref:E3 ubiquitin-protein ligase TRIM71 n=1 Tax=Macrostomum lignano TaxID=282301 RepID=A0A1I8FMU9_9PLAT